MQMPRVTFNHTSKLISAATAFIWAYHKDMQKDFKLHYWVIYETKGNWREVDSRGCLTPQNYLIVCLWLIEEIDCDQEGSVNHWIYRALRILET